MVNNPLVTRLFSTFKASSYTRATKKSGLYCVICAVSCYDSCDSIAVRAQRMLTTQDGERKASSVQVATVDCTYLFQIQHYNRYSCSEARE